MYYESLKAPRPDKYQLGIGNVYPQYANKYQTKEARRMLASKR